jgi:DNA-3-methyladenine glycosylase II
MAKTSRPRPRRDPWADAALHLRRVDPGLDALIERVGPCLIRPQKDRFGTLVRAIIGQQISTKAAASIDARLRALAGDPHTPQGILDVREEGLRSVGLSGVKARYALNLAEAVNTGTVPLHKYPRWSDEDIIASLTAVKGIGVWTAEMFLIFSLGRPDVWPIGDFGIRVALKNRHGLADHPTPAACRVMGDAWRPFRSIASWYLWRSLDAKYREPEEKEKNSSAEER